MADYFTNLSLFVPLPDKAAQEYALDLAAKAEAAIMEDDPLLDDFPEDLREVIEDWRFETVGETEPNKWGLWLHSGDGGVDAICAFIQHLLQKFDTQGRVAFEWSNDCSKPRVDAFGGGAALVTATEIKTMNTAEWLEQQAANAANIVPELVAALEMALPAVEYYHEHEGCPDTLKAVREALRNAHKINPPPASR